MRCVGVALRRSGWWRAARGIGARTARSSFCVAAFYTPLGVRGGGVQRQPASPAAAAAWFSSSAEWIGGRGQLCGTAEQSWLSKGD